MKRKWRWFLQDLREVLPWILWTGLVWFTLVFISVGGLSLLACL